MSGIKEIRSHIKSVEATLKITNAMYLISSSSLRKARKALFDVKPYYEKLSETISDILYHTGEVEHPYFDQRSDIPEGQRKVGYIVVTGDKGLAGAYNHNVIKLLESECKKNQVSRLFMVGKMGVTWCNSKGIPMEEDFYYTAQNPTIGRAREMSNPLLHAFLDGALDEIHVIYTHMVHPLLLEPKCRKLLPLDRDMLPWTPSKAEVYDRTISYYPSANMVLDHIVPDYFTGILLGTLVESYSSEQSSRMTAMDASTKNAKEMLRSLNLSYNRARQSAITQELTEIVGGAQAKQR